LLPGMSYSIGYPECVADLCALNNGNCPLNAICTPTGEGTRTCACAPGYGPQGTTMITTCTAEACLALAVGEFPLSDPHSSVGSCVARLPNEKCQLGCVNGFKPRVDGRVHSSVPATCVVHGPVNVYSFATFDCVADPGAAGIDSQDERDHHDNGDNSNGASSNKAWLCLPQVTPCSPLAPRVSQKDVSQHRLTLKWDALSASPRGDTVSSLVVHITPPNSPSYTTSPIPNAAFSTTITVDHLDPGTYTFRLYATTNNGLAVGLPLTVDF